jgi:transcriptional regulator with XRE-family HTH domain
LPAFPEEEIGKRIRASRLQREITLQELARRTSLSKSLLSKIENGKVSSPASTLYTIAKALNTKITYFFDDQDDDLPLILVRKKDRRQYDRGGAQFGYSYEALAYKRREKLMEPFILYTDQKIAKNVAFSHPGEELFFILDGTMEFTHGRETLILRKGDCIYFDASIPHQGKPVGEKPVKVFMVFCSGENSRGAITRLNLRTNN